MTKVNFDSDYDEALKRYTNLKNEIVSAIADKEYLLMHKFFRLKTDYITSIGYLEFELYDIDIKLGITKRKIEIIQNAIYNQEPVNLQYINLMVNKEFDEFLSIRNLKSRELDIAYYLNSLEMATDKEYMELKKYFKGLVMLVHPDINLEQNDVQKRYWEKGRLAYENEELDFLIIIYKLAKDETMAINKKAEISIEEIDAINKYYETKIKDEQSEMKAIQESFPFNKEKLLSDGVRIKAIQNDLNKKIKEGRSILKMIEDHFLMMLSETRYLN